MSGSADIPDPFVFRLGDPAVGQAMAQAIAAPDAWVHRRVESISFVSDRAVHRRVSVDLSLGGHTPELGDPHGNVRLVPMALLRKRTLSRLDIVDEDGAALPVLTTRQNGTLAGNALCELARVFLREAMPGGPETAVERIFPTLRSIALEPAFEAVSEALALEQMLRSYPAGHPLAALGGATAFLDHVHQFARNFLLVAVVPDRPSNRRILKFSYEEPVPAGAGEAGWKASILQALGWQPREFVLDLPGIVFASSFHAEVLLPEGVAASGAALFGKGVDGTDPAKPEALRLVPVPRRGEQRFHFHPGSGCTEAAVMVFWLRIARQGWLSTAAMATFGVGLLAFANAVRLPELGDSVGDGNPGLSTDVAALLMGLVALLASFAVRVGEHPVTARAVLAVRLATVLSVSTPLIAGWLLAFGPSGDSLRTAWWVLAIVSGVLFLCVLSAWVGPGAVTPLSYDASNPGTEGMVTA